MLTWLPVIFFHVVVGIGHEIFKLQFGQDVAGHVAKDGIHGDVVFGHHALAGQWISFRVSQDNITVVNWITCTIK